MLYPLFTSDFGWEYTSEGANKAIPGRKHALLWGEVSTKTCSALCFRDGEVRCVLRATRDRAHTKRDEALLISIHYFSGKCNIYQNKNRDAINYFLTKRKSWLWMWRWVWVHDGSGFSGFACIIWKEHRCGVIASNEDRIGLAKFVAKLIAQSKGKNLTGIAFIGRSHFTRHWYD